VLRLLVAQLVELEKRVTAIDAKIRGWHRGNPMRHTFYLNTRPLIIWFPWSLNVRSTS
jgi:hypothetical protein